MVTGPAEVVQVGKDSYSSALNLSCPVMDRRPVQVEPRLLAIDWRVRHRKDKVGVKLGGGINNLN